MKFPVNLVEQLFLELIQRNDDDEGGRFVGIYNIRFVRPEISFNIIRAKMTDATRIPRFVREKN